MRDVDSDQGTAVVPDETAVAPPAEGERRLVASSCE